MPPPSSRPLRLAAAACALLLAGAGDPSPRSFGVGRSQIKVTTAAETLLLAHNVSDGFSTAMVDFFWITGDPVAGSDRCGVDVMIWRFYVDGEAEASVAVSTAQAAFVGNADTSAPWSNEWAGKNSKFGGWHVNVPVPFSKSVRVTLQLPPWWPADERLFAMARGVEGLLPRVGAFSLPAGARLTASVVNASLAPLDFHTLVTVPAGTSGLFLGSMIDMQLYGPGAGSLNSLEGCWHFHSPPTTPFPGSFLLGTGAEDYPESAYCECASVWVACPFDHTCSYTTRTPLLPPRPQRAQTLMQGPIGVPPRGSRSCSPARSSASCPSSKFTRATSCSSTTAWPSFGETATSPTRRRARSARR